MTGDELSAVRQRVPLGTRVWGTVTRFPAGVGQAGMSVDVGDPVPGWVDQLWLPDEPASWPVIGHRGLFEVLHHRGYEIRLEPLDAGLRGRFSRMKRCDGPVWAAIAARWPVGALVEAVVKSVSPNDRTFYAGLDEDWSESVEYEGTPPVPGARVRLMVERQSEWTRSLVLRLLS